MMNDLTRLEALECEMREVRAENRQLRTWRRIAGFFMAATAVALSIALMPAAPAVAQTTLEQRVQVLEQKLLFVSRSGRDMIFNAVNVHVRNGGRTTESANSLGNLIVGFNEARPLRPDGFNPNVRSGSHNLIVESRHNYNSYGGLVVGAQNEILAPYASVSGGHLNTASSDNSSVSGGYLNRAAAAYAWVSGGRENFALSEGSSVSGGYFNTAGAPFGSVSGGRSNRAGGSYSSVSGGVESTTSGENASASGGRGINQSAADGWSGGTYLEQGFGIYQGRFRSP